jgi:hypothetical protein
MNIIHRAIRRFIGLDARIRDVINNNQTFLSTARGHLYLYRLMFSASLAKAALMKACGVPLSETLHREIRWTVRELRRYRQEHSELIEVPCIQQDLFRRAA